jgi:hypothetical protein
VQTVWPLRNRHVVNGGDAPLGGPATGMVLARPALRNRRDRVLLANCSPCGILKLPQLHDLFLLDESFLGA